MSHENASRETTFGYLSIIDTPEYGYFGGYLIISLLGRPLEFHCTAPVCPSRAQEILYGPTLQPYLLGEQIGGALLKVAHITPSLILTNCDAALQAHAYSLVPLVCISEINNGQRSAMLESTISCGAIRVNGYDFQTPSGHETQQTIVTQLLTSLGEHIDLAEPFGRIHEAIREAQRIGERGTDAHDKAA